MTICESIQIAAPPEAVWPLLEQPESWPLWNRRIQRVEVVSSKPYRVGFQARVQYRMSQRESSFLAEIIEFEPPLRLGIRYTPESLTQGRVLEHLHAVAHENGTRIQHRLDIQWPGVNPVWKALIWLVTRIGKKNGPGPLDHLKALVERR